MERLGAVEGRMPVFFDLTGIEEEAGLKLFDLLETSFPQDLYEPVNGVYKRRVPTGEQNDPQNIPEYKNAKEQEGKNPKIHSEDRKTKSMSPEVVEKTSQARCPPPVQFGQVGAFESGRGLPTTTATRVCLQPATSLPGTHSTISATVPQNSPATASFPLPASSANVNATVPQNTPATQHVPLPAPNSSVTTVPQNIPAQHVPVLPNTASPVHSLEGQPLMMGHGVASPASVPGTFPPMAPQQLLHGAAGMQPRFTASGMMPSRNSPFFPTGHGQRHALPPMVAQFGMQGVPTGVPGPVHPMPSMEYMRDNPPPTHTLNVSAPVFVPMGIAPVYPQPVHHNGQSERVGEENGNTRTQDQPAQDPAAVAAVNHDHRENCEPQTVVMDDDGAQNAKVDIPSGKKCDDVETVVSLAEPVYHMPAQDGETMNVSVSYTVENNTSVEYTVKGMEASSWEEKGDGMSNASPHAVEQNASAFAANGSVDVSPKQSELPRTIDEAAATVNSDGFPALDSNMSAAAANAAAKPSTEASVDAVADVPAATTVSALSPAQPGFPALGNGEAPRVLVNGSPPVEQVVEKVALAEKSEPANAQKVPAEADAMSTASAPAAAPAKKSWADLVRGGQGTNDRSAAPAVGGKAVNGLGEGAKPKVNGMSSGGSESELLALTKAGSPADDKMSPQLNSFFRTYRPNGQACLLRHKGLSNPSTLCYVNVVLHVIVSTGEFYNFLMDLDKELSNGSQGKAACRGKSSTPCIDVLIQFAKQFERVSRPRRSGNNKKRSMELQIGAPFDPVDTRQSLLKLTHWKDFQEGSQEDAQQFLFGVLDRLHEETKIGDGEAASEVQANGELEEGSSVDGLSENGEADGWLEVGPKKRATHVRKACCAQSSAQSVIASVCRVSLRTETYSDGKCDHAEVEPYWGIQTRIQDASVTSVKAALQRLSMEEVHEYEDTATKQMKEKRKKTLIDELPPVLFIHVLSAEYDRTLQNTKKIIKKFTYDVDLEISKDMLSSKARAKIPNPDRFYKLFAVVFHQGATVKSGHYVVITYDLNTNGWVLKDDSNVRAISENELFRYYEENKLNRMPYFLVYHRVGHPSSNGAASSAS